MKVLVIVAHPNLEESRANRSFMHEMSKHEEITVVNLYQKYPDWSIDIEQEQALLLKYDRIVFQFPFYWYSCPPLLKKWFDDVLTYGWAFGSQGDKLKGKEFIIATTAGGTEREFRAGGDNWFTISEYFRPIQATLWKCNGSFLPIFVTYNADAGSDEYISSEARKYVEHIQSSHKAMIK
ncbi:NAD(P)H-dependent oxidoreductase [Bacillus gobiensis]|uniref:NAD(P)H-dependent oxidoreductase n=1 Tax=Bacillus gobiensis TaxID=1441095 RepID=UPI003D1D61B3